MRMTEAISREEQYHCDMQIVYGTYTQVSRSQSKPSHSCNGRLFQSKQEEILFREAGTFTTTLHVFSKGIVSLGSG